MRKIIALSLFVCSALFLASCGLKSNKQIAGDEDYWRDSASFTETALMLKYDTVKVPGKLVVPKSQTDVPLVVFQSFTDEDMSFSDNKPLRDMAYGLARNGIASFRYASQQTIYHKDEIMVDSIIRSPKSEVMDGMAAAVDLIKDFPGIDKSRIFISGFGVNSQFVPWLASKRNDVRGMFLLQAYARSFPDIWLDAMKAMARQDSLVAKMLPEYERQYQNAVRAGTESFDKSVRLPFGNEKIWNDYREARSLEHLDSISIPALVLLCRPEITFSQKEYDLWKETLAGRKDSECKQYMDLCSIFLNAKELESKETRLKEHHVPLFVMNDMAEWIKQVSE